MYSNWFVRFLLMITVGTKTGQALIHPSSRNDVKESSIPYHGPVEMILQSTSTTTTDEDVLIDNRMRRKGRKTSIGLNHDGVRTMANVVVEALSFASWCFLAALSLITMEDVFITTLSPARRAFVSSNISPSADEHHLISSSSHQSWGRTTVGGLGFGQSERERLALLGYADDNPMVATLPSYNEIMLHHRTVNVGHWTKPRTTIDAATAAAEVKAAVHTVCQCLQRVRHLNEVANQYGWDELRHELHSSPLSDLAFAAADLGRSSALLRETAGFEWGSCAWRHCGALADAQEAIDELDAMLGVLEPFEARFCLDIVERSLRDILAVVDWKLTAPEDRQYYQALPKYESILRDEDDESTAGTMDDAYLRTLQDLRVD
jgi:hypothetical protein